MLVGRSQIGRATIAVLNINDAQLRRVAERVEELGRLA